MPGYEEVFVDSPLEPDLYCVICHLPMREPVLVSTCGHRFCDSCLQAHLRDGGCECPEDGEPLDYAKIYPEPDAQILIMASAVRCVHYKDGCRWVDKLHNLQAHLETCEFDAVSCPNLCSQMLSRLSMDEHMQYACERRKVLCDHCGQQFTGQAMESHEGNCPLEVVWCENKCGARIQNRYLQNHMKNECHKRTVSCPYCLKQFVFETIQSHYYSCPRFLVTCPNRCEVGKIPREDMEKHARELCPALSVTCPFKYAGCKHMCLRAGMEKHLEDSMHQHLMLLCTLVDSQQKHITALSSRLAQTSQITDGTLIWRITGFSQKLSDAKAKGGLELKSEPFLTSRYGYKLGASVFPDGNGSGEGNHLSVYIRVLPGHYDNILEWPFRLPISFRLLDQCSDPEKQQDILESFIPNPSWKHFQKPDKDSESMGFGYPKFVSHETLKHGSYIKDDVVFIKITVEHPSQFIIQTPSNSL